MSLRPDASFGEKVMAFNSALDFKSPLPSGISVMNPFRENPWAGRASEAFYGKYYADSRPRGLILGINPGRFGAGLTGVPFTDPKRLDEVCGISIPGLGPAHEPSSVFVYEVIAALGGARAFYERWYINSICPLGFVRKSACGRELNYNYYDDPRLKAASLPFILESLSRQLDFGIRRETCFCLGTGKNAAFIKDLNRKYGFFDRVVALEHPRYIVQYKWHERASYVEKYVRLLSEAAED